MTRTTPLLLALTLLPFACKDAAPHPGKEIGTSVAPRPPTQDDRMAWWRDARFGMFIHWGLYAIPAGEWPPGDPKANKNYGEWVREEAHIPVDQYEKLQKQFDPVKFDPELWARTARDAGMKYLVITSKHHDGFGLFDSKQTDWDVMGTPFHRDILAELSAACARNGVRFCTYHSIMDWHHPDYLPRRSWEKEIRPEAGADYERFERYLHAQVTEVVTKYHPGVMWFDGEWESTWNHARGLRLYELCRKLDPAMIVNNRVDVHRGGMGGFSGSSEAVGDFATPEQEIPATGMPGVDWETCMTMNDHWGFCAADADWKTSEDLIRKLADIASKGGNFLLNIGPRSDGTFPPEAIARLSEIGAWMKVNGESIHGTSASPFDNLPFGRCTVKVGETTSRLYLHVFDWPKDRRLVLPGLGNDFGRAFLLAKPAHDLPRSRAESDVWIGLSEAAPDPVDTVVVLEITGRPIVYKAPVIEADSDIFVKPMPVRIASSSPALEVRYTTDGTEPGPFSARYQETILVKDTATIRARSYHGGRPVSAVVEAKFSKVEPRAGQLIHLRSGGLWCERFEGDWDRLPDFEALKPVSSHDVRGVELSDGKVDPSDLHGVPPATKELPVNRTAERVALRFQGYLKVDADDVYAFDLDSDDGSRLWIDGELVADNDGLHSAETKRGRIALGSGYHTIVVGWFNKTGGSALSLKSGALGAALAPVTGFANNGKETTR
jgi:alpha-L-fucosidase